MMSTTPRSTLGDSPLLGQLGGGLSSRFNGQTRAESNDAEALLVQAVTLGDAGVRFRLAGDEKAADANFLQAIENAVRAAALLESREDPAGVPRAYLTATRWALENGQPELAREWINKAQRLCCTPVEMIDLLAFTDLSAWPDSWLVAAIRHFPPDKEALDELASRHWKTLFGRCQLLTLNREKAADLAQNAWCRVLRGHQKLKPGGNFPAYLATIATNLWRDGHRSDKRAGALGEYRLASLEGELTNDSGTKLSLAEIIPDLASLEIEEQHALKQDIDQALSGLEPQLREILVARFIDGETCAEIGRRHQRTEQTVSGWVRRGIQEMKASLQAIRSHVREELT